MCRDESLVIQKQILFAEECIQLKNWIRQDHTFTNNQRHVVKYSQGEWFFLHKVAERKLSQRMLKIHH